MIELEKLVSIFSMHSMNRDEAEIFYDQSAALFSWLVASDPGSVRTFFSRLRDDGARMASPEYMVGVFTECFGNPEAIHESWIRSINSF